MQLVASPGVAQLVRGHGHRREGAGGLAVQEAEALGELVRDQGARGDVVDQQDQLDVPAGQRAGVPIGTSSVTTATSASRSMPQSSLVASIGSRGPTKLSEAPWYMSGSVQNRSGSSAPRAFLTSSTWVT